MVKSPLTKGTVTLIKKIPVSFIIEGYLKTFGLDTSKYFDSTDYLSLYRCDDTGYEFYHPFEIAGDENFYDFFQEKYDWYYQKDKWEYEQALKIVNFKGAKVLEIGCGNGYFLKKALNKSAKIAEGLEFNSHAVRYCQSEGLNVSNKNLSEMPKGNFYDIICSFQVLEHIAEVNTFFKKTSSILKKNGKLIIAVPNNASVLFRNQNDLNFINQLHTENCLLNMPPHHLGRWHYQVFKNIEVFFSLKLINVAYEPIWNDRLHYLSLLNKEDNIIQKINFKLFRPFIKGHSILVILKKI
ncbi:MAG: class I SAM-dependent methyltransferase [Saprospiraceae bacterium]